MLFLFRIYIKNSFLAQIPRSLQYFFPAKPVVLLNVDDIFVISIDFLLVLVKLLLLLVHIHLKLIDLLTRDC